MEKLECTRRSPRFLFLRSADMTLCVCNGGYERCVLVKFCLNLWCSGWRVCENVVINGSNAEVVGEPVDCTVLKGGGDRGDADVCDPSRSTAVPVPERGLRSGCLL